MKVLKNGTEKTVFFEFSDNSNQFLIFDNQKFWFLVLVFGLETQKIVGFFWL